MSVHPLVGYRQTIHDSNTINSVLDLSYPKNFGESLSTITINFLKDTNTADDAILAPGKKLEFGIIQVYRLEMQMQIEFLKDT